MWKVSYSGEVFVEDDGFLSIEVVVRRGDRVVIGRERSLRS